MRYGKVWISLLTAGLMMLAVLLWKQETEPQEPLQAAAIPLSVQVSAEGKTEEITCWENENGEFYLFLPAFAQLSRTELRISFGTQCSLDGQALENGQSCEQFEIDKPYLLEYTQEGETHTGNLTFLRSANIPSLHIRVPSGSMDYIHAEKGNKETGSFHLYNPDGSVSFLGNLQSISGRGNGTWSMEKKPYSLTLAGEADLLGLGSAQRWVLLANGGDDSLLRNKLVYDYAAAVGMPYSPSSGWVDLYLNGEYAGVYQLCERNEIHPNRVALPEDGSFLVSMEWIWRLENQGYPHFRTDAGFAMRIHHSALETEPLYRLWQSAENAILAEDGIDPVTGKSWTQLIDVDSWARKYLMEEIFGSLDAGAVSQYFYGSTADGVIYAGPVWDFDLSMGNDLMWQLAQPEAFFADRSTLNAWTEDPWYHALCRKEAFRSRVTELYREEYLPLLEQTLTETLPDYAALLQEAAALNRVRWETGDAGTETEEMEDYMTRRMAFLTGFWLEGEQWHTVQVDLNEGSNTARFAVRPGDPLPQLPNPGDYENALGWYHRETDQEVDPDAPVTEDLDIYLKYEKHSREETKSSGTSLASLLSRVPMVVQGLLLLTVMVWDRFRRHK